MCVITLLYRATAEFIHDVILVLQKITEFRARKAAAEAKLKAKQLVNETPKSAFKQVSHDSNVILHNI